MVFNCLKKSKPVIIPQKPVFCALNPHMSHERHIMQQDQQLMVMYLRHHQLSPGTPGFSLSQGNPFNQGALNPTGIALHHPWQEGFQSWGWLLHSSRSVRRNQQVWISTDMAENLACFSLNRGLFCSNTDLAPGHALSGARGSLSSTLCVYTPV